LVQSSLLYGAEILGNANIDQLQKLELRLLRSLIGVRGSTPSSAVYGEFGHIPLTFTKDIRTLCFWKHLMSAKDNTLLRNTFSLSQYISTNLHHNGWASHLKDLVDKYGLNPYWEQNNINDLSDDAIKNIVTTYYIEKVWRPALERIEAKSGEGKNKLRTYRLFKSDFQMEDYLKDTPHFGKRIAFARLRTGSHDLPIETGRWSRITKDKTRKPRPAEDRYCDSCNREEDGKRVVGDETHWMVECEGNRGEFEKFKNLVRESGENMEGITLDVEKPQETFVWIMTCKSRPIMDKILNYVHKITNNRSKRS
jgi:hypothetical protein